ncbi:putative collagen alpha-5 chain [Golovinomyces cichoracearum]|uniref:Putative collagen alpha-5 chain n=1 Tax=Golovinomyces cichoracearum TaxID=62708 RepID=A0A420IPR0_9PEZI|nr:putative collagen alpha-5 chain [Golovinomyces cichoracearum]
MNLTSFLIFFGLIFGAHALLNETQSVVWVTITTDIYTTFCPSNTESSNGYMTSTASVPNFSMSTDCPCTLAQTAYSSSTSIRAASQTIVEVDPLPSFNPKSLTRVWITVTDIVSELTTFCSSSTEFVHNLKTYTITEPTTLTISDCPCTISRIVPATIQTTVASHSPGATKVTLSGITNPVSSVVSTTIPLYQVSSFPIKSPLSNYDKTKYSRILTSSSSKELIPQPTTTIANSQHTNSIEPGQVEKNVASNFNFRFSAIAAAGLLLFFCHSLDLFLL